MVENWCFSFATVFWCQFVIQTLYMTLIHCSGSQVLWNIRHIGALLYLCQCKFTIEKTYETLVTFLFEISKRSWNNFNWHFLTLRYSEQHLYEIPEYFNLRQNHSKSSAEWKIGQICTKIDFCPVWTQSYLQPALILP